MMGWSYYYLSFLSGVLELGSVLWGLQHGYSLLGVLGLVLAYQMGNIVLYLTTRRMFRKSAIILAGALVICVAFSLLKLTVSLQYITALLIFFLVSTVLQAQREAIKTLVAQWRKWKKRAFRVLGFFASVLVGAPFGNVTLVFIIISLLILSFYMPEFGFDGWLTQLKNGSLGKPRICWPMVTHQAHYFSYTYVLLIIAYLYYQNMIIATGWFVLNWIPYTITEPLVKKLRLEKYYYHIALLSHVFNAAVLVGMYLFLQNGSILGAVCLWMLTGFGGGNVFCIKEALKPSVQFHSDVWMFSEQIGHILGVVCCIVVVMLTKMNMTMLLGSGFAILTIPIILKYFNVEKRSKQCGR